MFFVTAIVDNVEIRGCEKMTGKKSGKEYLLVRFDVEDNTTGETVNFIDRHLEHAAGYAKGAKGSLEIWISSGRYKDIEIRRFRRTA